MTRVSISAAAIALILAAAAAAQSEDKPAENLDSVVGLLELVLEIDADTAAKCLATISAKAHSGELAAEQLGKLKSKLDAGLAKIVADERHALRHEAALLAACWKQDGAVAHARALVVDAARPEELRLRATAALVLIGDEGLVEKLAPVLVDGKQSIAVRGGLLAALGKLDRPTVATMVLATYSQCEPELQGRIVELMIQRPAWSHQLIAAVEANKIPPAAIGTQHLLRLQVSSDAALAERVKKRFGVVRAERNPQREEVARRMKEVFAATKTDPHRGAAMFKKLCAQCHKIHGEGSEVGPEITANGRASFDQLLSNVFDPSLVIGAGYQARNVTTADGRVLSGLPVEESEQRIVLKMAGGKLETIARENVDDVTVSPLSLMPEGIETQYTAQELADLLDYLALDRPPTDPTARYLPGTPARK